MASRVPSTPSSGVAPSSASVDGKTGGPNLSLETSLDTAKTFAKTILPSFYERVSRNIESSGAARLDSGARLGTRAEFWAAFQFWAGCNVSPLNVVLGSLGILQFKLDPLETFAIVVVASVIGAMATGLIAQYGPPSGLRTMMIARFTHGWYASRIVCILNAFALVAFLVIDTISCRDILLVFIPHKPHISTIVVAVLGSLATSAAAAGGATLEFLARWSWRPQLISMAVLVGGCLAMINTADESPPSDPDGRPGTTLHGRIGYGALVCNALLAFSLAGTDFSHAFCATSSRWKVVSGPAAGLASSHIAFVLAGVAVGEAARRDDVLAHAFIKSPATLIGSSLQRLGPIGTLCAVFFVVGSFGAISAGTYVAAVPIGPVCNRYDRWTRVASVAFVGMTVMISAHVGRGDLQTIAQSIVSIVGSLVLVWWIPSIADLGLIRHDAPCWSDWNVPSRLPCRRATLLASAVGTTCAILTIDQPWYTGPLARASGPAEQYVSTRVLGLAIPLADRGFRSACSRHLARLLS